MEINIFMFTDFSLKWSYPSLENISSLGSLYPVVYISSVVHTHSSLKASGDGLSNMGFDIQCSLEYTHCYPRPHLCC